MLENLNKYLPIPISIEGTKKILNQMENCICQIYKENNLKGTGFFCKIPFPNKDYLLHTLITNYNILKEEDIENNTIICININKEMHEIKIDNTRQK